MRLSQERRLARLSVLMPAGSCALLPCVVALWIIFFACAPSASAQPSLPEDPVARIGESVITGQDLVKRIELMPFPDREGRNRPDTLKTRALYSIIAEKLLANEARRLGLTADRQMSRVERELENLFIRDELFKREIVARSGPDEGSITAGMKRYATGFRVLSFLVAEEEAGVALTAYLKRGSPDHILDIVPESLYVRVDTIAFGFGAPDTSYENAAFAAGKSRVTRPFHSHLLGWAVLYILEKQTNPEKASMGYEKRRRGVEKILRERNETALVETYYYGVLRNQHAQADSALFVRLADAVSGLWNEDTVRFRNRGSYILTSDMVELLITRLDRYLDTVIVAIEDGDMTLGQLLEMFKYEDFRSREREGPAFALELNEAVKRLVARELLAREGRRLKLEYSPAVRSDLATWSDYLAAGRLWHVIRDSVHISPDEIVEHLIRNNAAFGRYYEVNVREVLTSTPEEMDTVLRDLEQGRSMVDLARWYSRRKTWALKGGESGYFVVADRPEIGFRAMMSDTGQVVGPIKTGEGYSLFVVLGTRSTREASVDFATLEENVRTRLLEERRAMAFDRGIASLAREQKLVINYDKLGAIKVNDIQMFTRRLIGFGGSMTAAPLLMRQWNWIKRYQEPGQVMP